MSDNETSTTTTTTPTPNNMPTGAVPPPDPVGKAEPTPPAAAATEPSADDEFNEQKFRAQLKEWKARAQSYADKAKRLDEIEEAQKSLEERLIGERDAARADASAARQERLREMVARETLCPPELINGDTEEVMRESAEKAIAWANSLKKSTPLTTPPASVVTGDGRPPNSGAQIQTLEELNKMSPEAIRQANKDGRLNQLKGIQ